MRPFIIYIYCHERRVMAVNCFCCLAADARKQKKNHSYFCMVFLHHFRVCQNRAPQAPKMLIFHCTYDKNVSWRCGRAPPPGTGNVDISLHVEQYRPPRAEANRVPLGLNISTSRGIKCNYFITRVTKTSLGDVVERLPQEPEMLIFHYTWSKIVLPELKQSASPWA